MRWGAREKGEGRREERKEGGREGGGRGQGGEEEEARMRCAPFLISQRRKTEQSLHEACNLLPTVPIFL